MISLDLTRQIPVDTTKLYLMKGRKVSVCHHCQKSVSPSFLLRCNDCRHDFCQNCLDACRCYARPGHKMNRGFLKRQRNAPQRHLALVSTGSASASK